jgi:acetoin utilization deacetylase AcuC-like enzyme
VRLVAPEPASVEALEDLHDPGFVRAVRRGRPHDLAASAGLGWDAGSGFCTFNGLALAARAAIRAGAGRIVVLDLDAHCGGGTASLVDGWPEVTHVDVSISSFDRYTPGERQSLALVRHSDAYLPTIEHELDSVDGVIDLVIYNAGMDPFDYLRGGIADGASARETLAARESLVFDWAETQGAPVALVLAGGYLGPGCNHDQLVDLHRMTIEQMCSGTASLRYEHAHTVGPGRQRGAVQRLPADLAPQWR